MLHLEKHADCPLDFSDGKTQQLKKDKFSESYIPNVGKFLDFIALVFYWSFLLFSWKFLFLCKIAKHKHKGILIYYIITLQYQHKE